MSYSAIGCTFDVNASLGVMHLTPGSSDVKHLPAMWETWVQSPGWEDPLEEGVATHSSIIAWRTPCTEEPGGLQSMGSQKHD